MSRAMEKYPGYSGYLLTNDDAILNYWNLVGLKRDRIWEGPKAAIRFKNYSMPSKTLVLVGHPLGSKLLSKGLQ